MIRLEYVPISDNEESGTADSLRLIKDRIKVREEFCAYYTRTEEINATAKNVITVVSFQCCVDHFEVWYSLTKKLS